jgi:hypothetical protein
MMGFVIAGLIGLLGLGGLGSADKANPVTDSIVAGTMELTLEVPVSAASDLQAWSKAQGPQFGEAFRNDSVVAVDTSINAVCKDIVACLIADVQVMPCYAYAQRYEGASPAFAEGLLVDFSLSTSRPLVTRFDQIADLRAAVGMLYAVCATKTVNVLGAGTAEAESLSRAMKGSGSGSTSRASSMVAGTAAGSTVAGDTTQLLLNVAATAIFQSPSADLNSTIVGIVLNHVVAEYTAAAASGSIALLQGALPATKTLYDTQFPGSPLVGSNATFALVDVEVAQDFSPNAPPSRKPAFPAGPSNLSPGGLAAIIVSSLVILSVGAGLLFAIRARRLRLAATAARNGRFVSLDHHEHHPSVSGHEVDDHDSEKGSARSAGDDGSSGDGGGGKKGSALLSSSSASTRSSTGGAR